MKEKDVKSGGGGEGDDVDEEREVEQRGIAPRMFKKLVCKGHHEFETMRQQDAYEFYQYVVENIRRNEK